MALNNIPPPTLSIPGMFEFSFIGHVPNYYLVLVAAIAYVVIARLVYSRVGRAMIALRENEPLAPAPSRRSRAGGVAAVVRAPARATSGRQRKTGRAMNAIPAVALSIDQLSIRFGGVSAVESMTFDVQEGELLSLIGPNGASKTSAFNASPAICQPRALARIRARDATVLLVEHDMKMVMRISDRVVCLNQGRIIANGPPADIQRHPEALGFARPRRRVALPLTGTEAGSSSKIRRSRRPISAPESTVLERLRLQDAHVVEGCRDGGEPSHRSARRSHVVGEAKDHRGLRR
jgi:hypothetical protein